MILGQESYIICYLLVGDFMFDKLGLKGWRFNLFTGKGEREKPVVSMIVETNDACSGEVLFRPLSEIDKARFRETFRRENALGIAGRPMIVYE